MTSLQILLDAAAAQSRAQTNPHTLARMQQAIDELRGSPALRKAVRAGQRAPDFRLPGGSGQTRRLYDLLHHGQVVLSFCWGGWSPYCNLELEAYRNLLPDLHAFGARMLVIAVETMESACGTLASNQPGFEVLSDRDLSVARAFGLAFEVPAVLCETDARHCVELPRGTGGSCGWLPVPATYVIAPGGDVIVAHVDADYRRRLEPVDVLAAVCGLARVA